MVIFFKEVIMILVLFRKILFNGFIVVIVVWFGDILWMLLKLFIIVIDLFRFERILWMRCVVEMFLKWILL